MDLLRIFMKAAQLFKLSTISMELKKGKLLVIMKMGN